MAIDLSLDDHQLMLQRSANEFFAKRSPLESVRDIEEGDLGYAPDVWHEMASLGWLGITYPEALGGGGGSFLDLYPIYEEMGRFLVPSPHLDTVVVGGDVLPGPMPRETLACLRALDIPARFIQGNGEREVLAVLSGTETGAVPVQFREALRWNARQLSRNVRLSPRIA